MSGQGIGGCVTVVILALLAAFVTMAIPSDQTPEQAKIGNAIAKAQYSYSFVQLGAQSACSYVKQKKAVPIAVQTSFKDDIRNVNYWIGQIDLVTRLKLGLPQEPLEYDKLISSCR